MSTSMTIKIPVRDRNGRVVGERVVVRYGALLSAAHNKGLKQVETMLLQAPSQDNGQTAIVRATVETDRGLFTGIGDASPKSVQPHMAPHLIRLAETRAKARALRDALNVSAVSLEELGDDWDGEPSDELPDNVRPMPRREVSRSRPARPRASFVPMSDSQRRYLYRLLAEQGLEGEQVTQALCETAGVARVNDISRSAASRLIDELKRGVRHA